MDANAVSEKLKALPSHLVPKAMDYIDQLLIQHNGDLLKMKEPHFTFDWEGGLSDLNPRYTSVELQHKAVEWR